MAKSGTTTIKRWGKSLAVRIPSAVAKSARLELGQRVLVRAQDEGATIVPVDKRALTLAERLTKFDPDRHGGECITSPGRGRALFDLMGKLEWDESFEYKKARSRR